MGGVCSPDSWLLRPQPARSLQAISVLRQVSLLLVVQHDPDRRRHGDLRGGVTEILEQGVCPRTEAWERVRGVSLPNDVCCSLPAHRRQG